MGSGRRSGIPDFAVERAAAVFVAAAPARVREHLAADPSAPFGPLHLHLTEDRGEKGWRWRVAEPFDGSAEVFLRADSDGCRVHVFLRSDEAPSAATLDRAMAGIRRRLFGLKDAVESGRAAGSPAVG